MKRLRVLQVLEATGGGTRRHLREIVTRLGADDFEFRVACSTRRDPEMLDDIRLYGEMGIDVEIIDMVRRPATILDLRAARALRASLRRNRVDLVHLHSSKAGFIGRLATWNLGVPVIYSPHAFPFLQTGWIGRVSWLAEKALAWRTNVLLAVSRAEGRLASSSGLFDPDRVVVVENAVENHRPAARLSWPMLSNERRKKGMSFGFLGELREQKDPLTFVRAARAAVTRGLCARFVMPRRGPLLAVIEAEIARLGLGGVFDFANAGESLDRVHELCEFGVLPSRWEGLPYALLDSMAMGKPVIASSIDVFRDIVEPIESGLLFDTGDVESLASRFLHWAAASRERTGHLADAVARFVARSHGMATWTGKLSRVYCDVASATAPPKTDRRRERRGTEPYPLAVRG
jgi:glycosyltransferase involved in cell wall biosynthesis